MGHGKPNTGHRDARAANVVYNIGLERTSCPMQNDIHKDIHPIKTFETI